MRTLHAASLSVLYLFAALCLAVAAIKIWPVGLIVTDAVRAADMMLTLVVAGPLTLVGVLALGFATLATRPRS